MRTDPVAGVDVLHVTHQFAPETRGGVESYVVDVGGEQARRGLDVHVLTGSHTGWERAGIEEVRVGGLPVHRLHRDDYYFDLFSKGWHPGAEALVRELLDRLAPRVVHVHQWIRMTSNLVEVARSRGIPTVVTLHDFYTSCPRAFRTRRGGEVCDQPLSVESCLDCAPRYGHESDEEVAAAIELFRDEKRAELELADAVLVGVGSTADLIASTTGIPRETFRVLPLGYRPRFSGRPLLPVPASEGTFRFAFWGGVGRHKGVLVLVEAFRALLASRPRRPVELHVLGGFATPELEAELRACAEGLPVTFHGPFTVEELYGVAPHAAVFPSTCLETHGLVLDECFELGLPCIVSEIGALPERAGDAALRVRPGDVGELARAMERLLVEPETRRKLRAGIPRRPLDLAEHCDALEAIYDQSSGAAATNGSASLARRRLELLWRQRESALALIDPREKHT